MATRIALLVLISMLAQTKAENVGSHQEILHDMTWLAGNWSGLFDGKPFEANYTSPKGGIIMSVSKEHGDKEPCFYEFEKFELIDGVLSMTPYPSGEKSDGFPIIVYDKDKKRAVFENKDHDFPTTFDYQRISSDTLEITVSGEMKEKLVQFKAILTLRQEPPMNDETKFTMQEFHKKQAVDLFNMTWEYLDKKDRTADDDEKMLQLAYASCFHWREIGTSLNQARGEWMISHVNVILGRKHAGLHHALRSLDICKENSYGDFDLAFGYEAAARASALAGNRGDCEKYFKLAVDSGELIADPEDKKIFDDQLQAGPWFGMR